MLWLPSEGLNAEESRPLVPFLCEVVMLKPLLSPHHFVASSVLRLGDCGFAADFMVDAKARRSVLKDCKSHDFPRPSMNALERPAARLIINPEQLPPQRLSAHFRAGAARRDEPFGVSRFMVGRRKYPNKLSVGPRYSNDDGVTIEEYLPEGQSIVLVCFEGNDPVGLVGLHLSVTRSSVFKSVTVDVLLDLVCVGPTSLDSSPVLDLTIGVCRIVHSLTKAAYRAAPRGAELQGSIDGDVQDATGRHLAKQVCSHMVETFEGLGRRGRRRTVTLGKVENHLAS